MFIGKKCKHVYRKRNTTNRYEIKSSYLVANKIL